jgi:hypothetical protein
MTLLRSVAARAAGLVLAGIVGAADALRAQQTYTPWLNASIERLIAARTNQRSNAKQVEASAVTGASTALVDQTSASDLVGFALHALGLPRNANGVETRGGAVTITPYALVSALRSGDPLSPRTYDALPSSLRRMIFTVGYEDEVQTDADVTDRVTVYGAKIVAYGGRDAVPATTRQRLLAALSQAAQAFGRIDDAVRAMLWNQTGRTLGFTDQDVFANAIASTAATFQAVLNLIGTRGIAAVDALIERELQPFLEVDGVLDELADAQRALQLSAGVVVKDRTLGPNSYSGTLMLDYGVEERVNLTVNARFEATDGPTTTLGASVAAQLAWQLSRPSFTGRPPATFSLALRGAWNEGTDLLAQGQAKFVIPLADGILFPMSLSVATRTELIDEAEVRGRIGFTLDTARLLAALTQR